jgi:hypothetical protein
MLNVGKLMVAPGVGRYYVEQAAGGREDYYAARGRGAGVLGRSRGGRVGRGR